jgi:hypothetical protein
MKILLESHSANTLYIETLIAFSFSNFFDKDVIYFSQY